VNSAQSCRRRAATSVRGSCNHYTDYPESAAGLGHRHRDHPSVRDDCLARGCSWACPNRVRRRRAGLGTCPCSRSLGGSSPHFPATPCLQILLLRHSRQKQSRLVLVASQCSLAIHRFSVCAFLAACQLRKERFVRERHATGAKCITLTLIVTQQPR
jgi:hypothetical protein